MPPRANPTRRKPDVHPELLDGLVQVAFALMAGLSQVAAAHDLSLTQLRVLAIIRDRQPRMAELASYLGLERSTVSGLIDRSADRGLVRRLRDEEDARVVRVTLSAAGQRLATRVAGEVSGLVAPMIQPLSPADQRLLADLLGRLLG